MSSFVLTEINQRLVTSLVVEECRFGILFAPSEQFNSGNIHSQWDHRNQVNGFVSCGIYIFGKARTPKYRWGFFFFCEISSIALFSVCKFKRVKRVKCTQLIYKTGLRALNNRNQRTQSPKYQVTSTKIQHLCQYFPWWNRTPLCQTHVFI